VAGRVQNGRKKASDLGAEDRIVLLAPFLGPMIRVGLAAGAEARWPSFRGFQLER